MNFYHRSQGFVFLYFLGKIPQFIRMFQNGGGDVTKYKEMAHPNFVNYAKDGTHLVLLNGFELPIQPYVKKADQQKQGQQTVNPQQQQQQQQQQAVSQQPTAVNPQQNAVSLYI